MDTDRERVAAAFRALRKRGWFARMNFWCCQSCGCAAVPDSCKNKFVFYHSQDAAAIDWNGNISKSGMYMTHGSGGEGKEICEVLRENGLEVEWDGDNDRRILVKHKVELTA